MSLISLITTSDGSHSLMNVDLHETYHSVHGAITESKHVFIQRGLDYWYQMNRGNDIRILEIGFGTGLNVLMTFLQHQQRVGNVYYESWDTFPVDASVVGQLNYGAQLDAEEPFSKIHEARWDQAVQLSPAFTLRKKASDILTQPIEGLFDLVYYDAFAPSKQPTMWTLDILKKITDSMTSGGIWVTYCAKGQLKRDLRTLGLTVETLPGPPGKKEMVRANVL